VNSGIDLEEISISELYDLVWYTWKGDEKLISDYQQIKGDFSTMVNRNISNIKDASSLLNLAYYKVNYKSNVIGFTVVDAGKSLLYSFGIRKEFRKECSVKWIETIKSMMNGIVHCALWNQNQRAIRFLKKNDFKEVRKDKFVTYLTHL